MANGGIEAQMVCVKDRMNCETRAKKPLLILFSDAEVKQTMGGLVA